MKRLYIQQVFSLLYLQVRNNQNRLENCQKLKKIQLRRGNNIFLKDFGKIHNFEVLSTSLEFQGSKF